MDTKELEQKMNQDQAEITIGEKLIEGSVTELENKQKAIDVIEWQKKRIIYLEEKIRVCPMYDGVDIVRSLEAWRNSIEGI